jgi:hypothetical protein
MRDTQLLEFRRRTIAQRRTRPDGAICYDRECYFYDVTATLTGHFFPREQTKDGGMAGYGHLGFFHLLFIEQVTDIDARRTPVPAGGVFQCKAQPLTLSDSEVQELISEHAKAHDQKSWEEADQRALLVGARHWGEPPINIREWRSGNGEEQSYFWNSTDLLKILSFKFPFQNTQAGTSRSEFTATRTTCSATVKPLPQSAKIGCEAPYWREGSPKSIAEHAQSDIDGGKDLWWLSYQKVAWRAVQEYAKGHSIKLGSKLKLVKCSESLPRTVEEDSFASCEWATPDGLQSAYVSLVRYAKLTASHRQIEKVVWVPQSGRITNCTTD